MLGLVLAAALSVHDHAERALGMLTYVAGDYPSAVGASGQVLSREELDEQVLFAREAADDLRSLGAADLATEAAALSTRIESRESPVEVVVTARRLADRIEQRFALSLLPPREPHPAKGLYVQACAACHGAKGAPARRDLSTMPPDLSSKEEVARLSPRRIFTAITYGVPGTAMPSYAEALSPEERWDLAWYVLTLAHADRAERRRGAQILARLPRRPDYLQLAVRTDEQLRKVLSGLRMSDADREAVLTACRDAR